jgi:hypothetical protein
MSMSCGSWNAGELCQPADPRGWLLLEGIKNGVIDNGIRGFFGGVAGNRGEVPLAQKHGHRQVCDSIRAEHSNKVVVGGLSRESFHREKQADQSLIH